MFLKNKNIIFKIRRSKVTDYAALSFLDKLFHFRFKRVHCVKRGVRRILKHAKLRLNKKAKLWADLLAHVGYVNCIFVTFPCGILGQVWYLIVSFPDFCLFSYFKQTYESSHLDLNCLIRHC